VADEDGFTAPFNNNLWVYQSDVCSNMDDSRAHVLALGYLAEIYFDFGLCEDIGGSGHVDKKI